MTTKHFLDDRTRRDVREMLLVLSILTQKGTYGADKLTEWELRYSDELVN